MKKGEKSMTDDVARSPPWNDFKDTPEARDAVTRMEAHYTPIVVELRQDVADKDQVIKDQKEQIDALMRTTQLQHWLIIGSCRRRPDYYDAYSAIYLGHAFLIQKPTRRNSFFRPQNRDLRHFEGFLRAFCVLSDECFEGCRLVSLHQQRGRCLT